MGLPPSVHDPQKVRDLAEQILGDARYQRPSKSIPDRILGWFLDQIGSVVGSLVGSGAGAVVAWAAVLGVVSLTILLIVRYGRVGGFERSTEPTARLMVELARTPAEWLAEAEAMEAAGRWKEGLRCRHRALVGSLVHRGAIPERAGRTAREYVGDVVVARVEVAAEFAEATDLFEQAWYGDVPTGPDESARFQQLGDDILGTRVRT
ncbi:MAG: DUF4129 domain-containing protein [Acidimicrobiales bacterium]